MKTHTIAFVTFIAAALAVAAIMVTSRTGSSPESSSQGVGERVLPALAQRINDAAEVRIHRAGGGDAAQRFTFRRDDRTAGWTLVEKHGYPVKAENLRTMLIGLAELKTVEAKTSRPELYPRIGVQDPGSIDGMAAEAEQSPEADPPAQPTLVTILDADSAEIGAVIIGTTKWSATPEVFIRRKGEAQAWLAAGRIDVPFDELAWVDRTVISIPRERWKSVSVTHADGETLRVMKADATQTSFFVEAIPEGRQLTSAAAGDTVGNVFSSITLDDVRPVDSFDGELLSASVRTVGTSFDGLVISARTFDHEGKQWAMFEAAAENAEEQAEAAKQADELNRRLSGWAFAVPSFRSKALLTRWSDLLKPVEEPALPVIDESDHSPAEVEEPVAPPQAESP